MKNSRSTKNINLFDKITLSFFGAGLIPFAPGTWGTIAAIPIGYLLIRFSSPIIILSLAIILTIIFSIYLEKIIKRTGLHDPGWVVIDEVIGYLVAISFIPSPKLFELIIAAFIFRFFDIFKIWPASFFDKKIKNGAGIILDDVVAGIYTCIIMFLIKKFQYTCL